MYSDVGEGFVFVREKGCEIDDIGGSGGVGFWGRGWVVYGCVVVWVLVWRWWGWGDVVERGWVVDVRRVVCMCRCSSSSVLDFGGYFFFVVMWL